MTATILTSVHELHRVADAFQREADKLSAVGLDRSAEHIEALVEHLNRVADEIEKADREAMDQLLDETALSASETLKFALAFAEMKQKQQ